MLGNGIKQTTTTTGTGALTVAAVAGMPTIADVFPINVPVSYALVDSAGLFIEAGIGRLTGASTFERSRVCATYVSGVYDATSPAPASLSGTTTLIVTPHAGTIESMAATVDGVSSGIGRMLTSGNRTGQTATGIWTLNRLVYVPFLLRVGALVTSLSANVTAAQPSLVAKMGIYACGANGYMGDLLASAPDIDCSTTGLKTATLSAPVFLPPGQYFTALVSSGAGSNGSGTLYANANASVFLSNPFGLTAGTINPIDARFEALSAGAALPTTPNQATSSFLIGSGGSPVVYVGVE